MRQVETMDALGETTVHYAVVEFAHSLPSAKRVRHITVLLCPLIS
jgi:hypothetical protein